MINDVIKTEDDFTVLPVENAPEKLSREDLDFSKAIQKDVEDLANFQTEHEATMSDLIQTELPEALVQTIEDIIAAAEHNISRIAEIEEPTDEDKIALRNSITAKANAEMVKTQEPLIAFAKGMKLDGVGYTLAFNGLSRERLKRFKSTLRILGRPISLKRSVDAAMRRDTKDSQNLAAMLFVFFRMVDGLRVNDRATFDNYALYIQLTASFIEISTLSGRKLSFVDEIANLLK